MIKVSNISKYFGSNKVLESISTIFKKGEVVAIIGPSGSGKSTLLRCLNCLEKPSEGRIYLNDVCITKSNINIRLKIGMVFQHFNLFPHMTVMENLIYAPMNVKKVNKNKAIQLSTYFLKKVGLENKNNCYPAQLSGGEKQRVAIARCLVMEPEVILFDEPTSALDPEMVKEVLNVINDLVSTGITMLIITHEMNFARKVADRILFMAKGRIVEDSIPGDFFSNPKTIRAREFLNKVL